MLFIQDGAAIYRSLKLFILAIYPSSAVSNPWVILIGFPIIWCFIVRSLVIRGFIIRLFIVRVVIIIVVVRLLIIIPILLPTVVWSIIIWSIIVVPFVTTISAISTFVASLQKTLSDVEHQISFAMPSQRALTSAILQQALVFNIGIVSPRVPQILSRNCSGILKTHQCQSK